ncbi:MAG: cobalamin-binding protein [Chloroflexi bacterium]|nr:cobalamin-binding protein [Chloroflexota bacterium]
MESNIESVYESVVSGEMQATANKVQIALDSGLSANNILQNGLISAMGEVGKLFEEGEFFVPEMLISANSMKFGLNLLRPYLVAEDVQPLGKVLLATVQGDLHDIGKNLVGMMLEGSGFEVIDMGIDVKPEDLIEAVKEHKPDIVGLSALLTTTMVNMKTAITMMEDAGMRDGVKIIVGGAPVTQDYANQVGADGFGKDASEAANIAKQLML